ncbi:putative ABC transporter ATP-binding protein [Streptomyces sp. MBT84]|nr:putative ABC transporter ATP-binding protein [Streptomyces sp. MBT84]
MEARRMFIAILSPRLFPPCEQRLGLVTLILAGMNEGLLERREGPAGDDAAAEAMVVVEDLVRTFGTGDTAVHALGGVSFSVARGELVALKGRSGSGKTTLLNIIGGLDRADAGRVTVDGTALNGLAERDLLALRRDRMGFVFQSFGLLPILTAAENVGVPLRLRNTPAANARNASPSCSPWSASTATRDSAPARCPAASSNASPSPAPWPTARPDHRRRTHRSARRRHRPRGHGTSARRRPQRRRHRPRRQSRPSAPCAGRPRTRTPRRPHHHHRLTPLRGAAARFSTPRCVGPGGGVTRRVGPLVLPAPPTATDRPATRLSAPLRNRLSGICSPGPGHPSNGSSRRHVRVHDHAPPIVSRAIRPRPRSAVHRETAAGRGTGVRVGFTGWSPAPSTNPVTTAVRLRGTVCARPPLPLPD